MSQLGVWIYLGLFAATPAWAYRLSSNWVLKKYVTARGTPRDLELSLQVRWHSQSWLQKIRIWPDADQLEVLIPAAGYRAQRTLSQSSLPAVLFFTPQAAALAPLLKTRFALPVRLEEDLAEYRTETARREIETTQVGQVRGAFVTLIAEEGKKRAEHAELSFGPSNFQIVQARLASAAERPMSYYFRGSFECRGLNLPRQMEVYAEGALPPLAEFPAIRLPPPPPDALVELRACSVLSGVPTAGSRVGFTGTGDGTLRSAIEEFDRLYP